MVKKGFLVGKVKQNYLVVFFNRSFVDYQEVGFKVFINFMKLYVKFCLFIYVRGDTIYSFREIIKEVFDLKKFKFYWFNEWLLMRYWR